MGKKGTKSLPVLRGAPGGKPENTSLTEAESGEGFPGGARGEGFSEDDLEESLERRGE